MVETVKRMGMSEMFALLNWYENPQQGGDALHIATCKVHADDRLTEPNLSLIRHIYLYVTE
jgi:hypothetical protein